MPTYEYQCRACGHQLEAFQKMTEAPLTECPKCHQTALGKLISATHFQLKGTGWYATDFRDKGKPKQPNTPEEKSSGDHTDRTDGTSEKAKTKDSSDSSSNSSNQAAE